ncbi:hypothetical protein AGMMS49944_26840 [Spirochaetia bacterium]|nr:hypothetical protein AGMMS49944_26840 [Spirochaetia bacterium]
MIKELIEKIKFDLNADRIGPDIPFTHWNLFFHKRMVKLCKRKFSSFSDTSGVRPGVYAVVCSKISIGRNVIIRPGSMLFGDLRSQGYSIIIEDNVLLGPCVQIYVNNHKFAKDTNGNIYHDDHTEPKSVILRKGCWIGANAIILPGVEIGEYAIVGAGSIVAKSVSQGMMVVGNPARFIKNV